MVMGTFRTDYPLMTITIQRWQKNWINTQQTINFSGLVQEMLTELIKARDPDYYLENKPHLENGIIQRHDVIKTIIKKHPEIMPSKY